MIISVVFVSMMVVFVTVYYFVAKPKKQQEKIYSAMTTDELIRFVQSMHCELAKRIDADAIIIGFQGGYFHLLREKTGQNIQLYYKDFYACSYEQSKKIVFDINNLTADTQLGLAICVKVMRMEKVRHLLRLVCLPVCSCRAVKLS